MKTRRHRPSRHRRSISGTRRRALGAAGGRRSTCAGTRTCWSTGFELLSRQRLTTARRRRDRATSRTVSPETEVRRALHRRSRDPWDFEEVYGALHDFARGYAVRARARGLPRPHHHRHARRADLPVPADRGAPLPGAAAADLAAARRPARRARHATASSISISRSTTASRRAFAQEQRESRQFLKAGIATRNAAFNRADRAHRAGRDRARARRCC